MTVLRLLRRAAATVVAAVLTFGLSGLLVADRAAALALTCSAPIYVNVRSGPGTSYAILGRLLAGETIQSRGVTTGTGWTPVTFNGQNAFIFSTYLRLPGVAAAPSGPIAGYSTSQLANAQLIIRAGQAMGLDDWTITVGVMTAMGESSLRNINYGDKVGPDSRGLFQQRGNGAWGSYSDRMTPTIAATNFFRALLRVPNYRTLTPTLAAHRTQRNRDPNHFAKYWPAATQVFTRLKGSTPAPAAGATPTGVVGSGSVTATVTLNIRSGAGLEHPIVDVVAKGAVLQPTGRTSNGFTEIVHKGQVRWAYTTFVGRLG